MQEATTLDIAPISPVRVTDDDGAAVEVFRLPPEQALLERMLRDLFERHWQDIVFGPIIEGAAWEMRAPHAPSHVGVMDGYLTIAFGAAHFHLCIGPTKGMRHNPTPPALAQRRRCARAELFRRLDAETGAPNSWGLRLYNGAGEQQMTVFFPNPFLSPDGGKVLKQPDWSRLALWDEMRARYAGQPEADAFDRSGKAFRHG